MAGTPSEESKSAVSGKRARAGELEEFGTVMEISTELKSRELQKKFMEVVMDIHRTRDQNRKLLDEKKEREDKLHAHHIGFIKEKLELEQELAKLKEDFAASQWQNSNLHRQLHERNARDRPLTRSQKRRLQQSQDCEAGVSSTSCEK